MEFLSDIQIQVSIYFFVIAVALALIRAFIKDLEISSVVSACLGFLGFLYYVRHHIRSFDPASSSVMPFAVMGLIFVAVVVVLTVNAQLKGRAGLILEVNGIIYFALAGLIYLLQTSNLVEFYLLIELVSLAVYALIAFNRADEYSIEAVIKYFIQGGVFSAVLLLGFSVFYSATGTLDFSPVLHRKFVMEGSGPYTLSVVLILFALLFKLGAAPFHFWVPDAYTGAMTSVTAFMSTAVKAALMVYLALRIDFIFSYSFISNLIEVFAVLSMLIGTYLALKQSNIKRMLAYSSIAHTGYMLTGFIGGVSQFAVFYYAVVYVLMTMGAFTALILLEKGGICDIGRFSGAAKSKVAYAAGLSVILFSLAGVPLTGGFLAKLYILKAGFNHGAYLAVVIMLFTTIISFYYYLRIVVHMFMRDPAGATIDADEGASTLVTFIVILSAVGLVALGTGPLIELLI